MSDQNQYLRATTSQNLTLAALSYTTAFGQNHQLFEINIHFGAAVTETVTITFSSRDGSNYNTVLQSTSLTSATDFVFRPSGHLILMDGDEVIVACTHATATATAYVTIIAEPYGHQAKGSISSPKL